MPRAAVELGAVDKVLPLDLMPHTILRAVQDVAEKPASAVNRSEATRKIN
jgi:chemotaxis response regulator CheB